MKKYTVQLSEREIDVIIQMFAWGQIDIIRQMKKLGKFDFDLKEYYWGYRSDSHDIKDKLNKIRGYPLKR